MKLLIVDDSNIIRSRIARIALHPRLSDITIVGLAKNGLEALELSRRAPPDVVTMGCVYFSAPRLLMCELLLQMQEPDTCEQNLLDAVGEVANTISGNARRHLAAGSTYRCRSPSTGQRRTSSPPSAPGRSRFC